MYQLSAFQYEVLAQQRLDESARLARRAHPQTPAVTDSAVLVDAALRRRWTVLWRQPSRAGAF